MATVNKNFKIKSGLVVEGTTGTIDGNNILTENASDQYIIDLIGGETLVTSVESTQLEVVNGELNVKANVFDAYGAASTAQSAAESYADSLSSNYDAAGAAATAEQNAKDYADNLTTDDVAEGTAVYFTNQRALDATASAYDAAGAAATAEQNAISHADGLAGNYDAAGAAATAEQNAINYADSLTTSDIAEGTNEYFTAERAQDAIATALSNGTHTNITVDYDDNANSISLTGAVTYTDEDARDAIGTALTAGANAVITVDDNADTITVAVAEDIVIPSTGSLEVESNDVNFGAPSLGLRTTDAYVNPLAVFSGDFDDDYAQVVIKNTGSGVNSSSDLQLYSNNGDDINGGWVDLGITSSTFSDPNFTITTPNDGYIFMEAPEGTDGNGDFVIATGSNGARNAIVFAAGGLQSDNTQMTILPDESVTIAINTPSTSPSTGALVVQGGVGIQGDVNIEGNITFGGEGTSLTTENLAVTDPLIYVGDQNAGDAVDMGIVTEYKDGATTKFAGVVRDASDGVFKVFSGATTKPTSTVDFAGAGLEYGDLKVDEIVAASATLTNVTIGVVDQDEIAYLNGVTSNIQDQLDAKQAEVTAGDGLSFSGTTLNVDLDPTSNLTLAGGLLAVDTTSIATRTYADGAASDADTSARGYADSLASNYDVAGSAATAESNANDYTDTAITNLNLGTTYDAYGAAATAEQNAKDYADNLTTDDVAEGNNVYFTEARVNDVLTTSTQTNISITEDVNGHLVFVAENGVADSTTDDLAEGEDNLYYTAGRAKSDAATLLVGATLSNITITGDGSGLTITAENGVAGSDTDDLAEGSTNLYFTDQRALDAVANETIYPTAVEINDYRKEEATRVSAASESTVNLHTFDYPYESAKYLVRVVGWVGGVKHSQITEILLTKDGNNNIAITEYGMICTNTNNIASFTATESSGAITLTATTGVVSSCEIVTAATLLSWAD